MLIACQAFLLACAMLACMGTAFGLLAGVSPEELSRYPIYGTVIIAGLVIEALYRSPQMRRACLTDRSFSQLHPLVLRQTVYAIGGLILYVTIAKDPYISRTVLLLLLPATYVILLWSNRVLPRCLCRWFFRNAHEDRVVLIGSSARAARLKKWLRNREVLGMCAVGILTDDTEMEGDWVRLGAVGDLDRVLREEKITQAILLELPASPEAHEEMLAVIERNGARLLILSNLDEKLHHHAVHFEEGDLSFIAPRNEPLENPMNRLVKRALDMAIALPIVVFVLPALGALVWILQRIQSPGPLFCQELRGGIQNREFKMLKFRTARLEDGKIETGPEFRAGRWLCRLRLDDFPKFLNVLNGEMSLVGPRPYSPDQNIEFRRQVAHFWIRTTVKPGVTGLGQVRGFRGNIRSIDRVQHQLESDADYIENWRLALDVAIISRTILQMMLFALNGLVGNNESPDESKEGLFRASAGRGAANGDGASAYIPRWMRPEYRHILGIRFLNGTTDEAVSIAMQGGLIVAPSAPVLLALKDDPVHRTAVANCGLAITDSGLMVLLWKLMTGDTIKRVSGLAYLKRLLEMPQMCEPGCMFWVMPNKTSMERNLAWLQGKGFPVTEDDCYLAPRYEAKTGEIADTALLEILQAKRPTQIIMAIGGGTQERLGAFLCRNLDYRPAIHCTGAAIGFLSGDQARIPMWADRFRLGWLCRCLDDPRRFVPRYWEARKLVRLMFDYHGHLPISSQNGASTSDLGASELGEPL
jgi:putative colanic acid biosynthesis UDP-glucose lipid carrier transferase